LNGIGGNKKHIEFTVEERIKMEAAVNKMVEELKSIKF